MRKRNLVLEYFDKYLNMHILLRQYLTAEAILKVFSE